MRKMLSIVAVGFAMVVGSNAMAKDATAKPVHGKVTAVTPETANPKIEDITVTPHAKKGETATDVVIKADDTTKVTKDGAAATLADVTTGSIVSIIAAEDTTKPVTEIDIKSPKKKAAAPTK